MKHPQDTTSWKEFTVWLAITKKRSCISAAVPALRSNPLAGLHSAITPKGSNPSARSVSALPALGAGATMLSLTPQKDSKANSTDKLQQCSFLHGGDRISSFIASQTPLTSEAHREVTL